MENFDKLKEKAFHLRRKVFDMCVESGGHLASSFSCMEILVSLYYGGWLNVASADPDNEDRDRFILSKGHAETVLYAILGDLGFFPDSWIEMHYRRGDCRLGGHPDHKTPGVEITSGALGHGLGIGAGISVAARLDDKPHKQVVLLGDAECTEGSVWEAAMFAAQRKLDNLIAVVDRNRIGSLDYTRNYAGLFDLAEKWRAFGWEVIELDGHDFNALDDGFCHAWEWSGDRPVVIVANTVKGKGISFVENEPIWHVKAMTDPDEIIQAKKELGEGFHADIK